MKYEVLIYLVFLGSANTQTCDPESKPKSNSQRIKEQLLCKHDKNTRPGFSTKNQTKVSIFISPITLEFVESSTSLKLQTWIELFWIDETFSWNDQDYNNTSIVLIDANKLWIPDISLINWKEDSVEIDKICTTVVVGYEGWLYTGTIPVLSGHCVPDWTKWPFDIQNCEMHLTSRQYLGNEVDFALAAYDSFHQVFQQIFACPISTAKSKQISPGLLNYVNKPRHGLDPCIAFNCQFLICSLSGLYMEDYIPSREWEVIGYRAERLKTDYGTYNGTQLFRVDIKVFLSIKRHASVLIASYVMPGFVMMVISLSVLWFNPLTSQRIPIICVLVLLQSLYLQYLAYKIPSNGATTPGIVVFYGGSLILTIVLMILTMLTRSMHFWNSKPTSLSTLLNLLRTNRTFQLILITDVKTYSEFEEDRNEESVNQNSKIKGEREWQELALAINRIAFLILLPIYLILFLYFIV